jgi:hypothetical protein
MAMPMHDCLAMQMRGLVILHFVRQKFTEQVHVLAESSGVFVVRKEIASLVPKDSHTAWLETYDRHPGLDTE